MKKSVSGLLLTLLLLMITNSADSQTYKQLWQQQQDALAADLPQTQLKVLGKIEAKGRREQQYGQLLKATLLKARLQAEVAPDSLRPAVERLENEARQQDDETLKLVYEAVLALVYRENPTALDDDDGTRSSQYLQQVKSGAHLLAHAKDESYEPFVITGSDADVYNGDLLNIVGREMGEWQWMNDYYVAQGNRRAACLTALHTAGSIEQIDSLIDLYGDLPEACELAIRRYDMMGQNYSPADRYRYLQQAIDKWPAAKRAQSLRNAMKLLTLPRFSVTVPEQVTMPGRQQVVQLYGLRNLSTLTMNVYKTPLSGDTQLYPNDANDYKKLKPQLKLIHSLSRTLTFGGHETYEEFADSIVLEGLPAGVYMLEFTSKPDIVTRSLLYVSGLRLISQQLPGNSKKRLVVVDASTGQPVQGARLQLNARRTWNKPVTAITLTTNSSGEALYADKGVATEVFVYTDADRYLPKVGAGGHYMYYAREYNREHLMLVTDRAIYRPGQTLHVAALLYNEQSSVSNHTLADRQITIALRDANYKVVAEQTATTDSYGHAAVSFTLPTGRLNGMFTLRAQTGGASQTHRVRVEEYKRPTFRIDFADYDQPYQSGDTVSLTARAESFAGVAVAGARVKYKVSRRVAYWWTAFWRQNNLIGGRQNEEITSGETTTDGDGHFYVSVPLMLPGDDDNNRTRPMFYNYQVEADVTDAAGETHTATYSLPLGTRPTVLTINMPEQVRRDKLPKATFERRNAAGKTIEGKVRYRISTATGKGTWRECDANTPSEILKPAMRQGEYLLEAVCGQDTVEQHFIVFGLDDTAPAAPTHDWFYVSHTQFPADGSPVTVQVGASDNDLHIVYSIFAEDREIESGALKESSSLWNRRFAWHDDYGNGLLLTFAWIKDGQYHHHKQFIGRPLPDTQLRLQWTTFRDRLTPGQQEKWQMTITQPDGKAAEASLMAVLYDKSLDLLAAHQWTVPQLTYVAQSYTEWYSRQWPSISLSEAQQISLPAVNEWKFSEIDHSVMPYWKRFFRTRNTTMMRSMSKALETTDLADSAPVGAFNVQGAETEAVAVTAEENVVTAGYAEKQADAGNAMGVHDDLTQQQATATLRENLQETAFFYPQVETDASGRLTLSFTLPESLTTWRFMGLANTRDMLCSVIEGEAVAQKQVMIMPNVPRFLREGDEGQIQARIISTTDADIQGRATLTLTDAETSQTVYSQSTDFTLAAKETGVVTFAVPASTLANRSLLICRLTAEGNGFSDGEQHYLPVLPLREHVTLTVPITQTEAGTKAVDLKHLFPEGATQRKLTVEYTNNPAWLMVQALPVVGQPREHSAIEQAAAFYSNAIGRHLINQTPQARTVMEQWKREEDHTSLTSQLEKNQELKDITLAETPWMWEADRETAQKQQLTDFFDDNTIAQRLATCLEKLRKLQNSDGSFSWYEGMPGSMMVTVAVAEILARQQIMTGQHNDSRQMQNKAMKYMDSEIRKVTDEMKRRQRKGQKPTFPSFTALRWLYVHAISGNKEAAAEQAYLIDLLKKEIRSQSIYEKAMTAVILDAAGQTTKAADYVKSLKEYTVCSEEMGRYYDTPRAGYSWYDYRIPTEVSAIEAIRRITPGDRQTIDEMCRWLLQEKRTQAWSTPINSVNAIYAFLADKPDLMAAKEQTTIDIDGKTMEMPQATAGLGYVKTSKTLDDNTETPRLLTATKTSDGMSWGAVYAQFMQKTSQVEAAASGITVKRELISTRTGQLKKGDKVVVRLTITAERDLDFVQVSDQRAACMEPVKQISGYRNGAYVSPKDYATNYYFCQLSKGRHVIETEYYIDRVGQYETGILTAGCAYAPEFSAKAPSMTINVSDYE